MLLRVEGSLKSGKPSDINWNELTQAFYARSAFFVMRNTVRLSSQSFEEIKVSEQTSETVEEHLIKEHLGQVPLPGFEGQQEEQLVKQLMRSLSLEKEEAEKAYQYEERIKAELNKILQM